MNQVTVNGQNYLGTLTEGEGKLIVENGMAIGSTVTKGDVQRYFQAENLGQLKDITFGGNGVSFAEVELDEDIKFAIKVAGRVMENDKSVAVRKLENAEFVSGLGKM